MNDETDPPPVPLIADPEMCERATTEPVWLEGLVFAAFCFFVATVLTR